MLNDNSKYKMNILFFIQAYIDILISVYTGISH